MAQISRRPSTANILSKRNNNGSIGRGREMSNLVASEKIQRFRDDFPNLPGFSKYATLRPQSPKVRKFMKIRWKI